MMLFKVSLLPQMYYFYYLVIWVFQKLSLCLLSRPSLVFIGLAKQCFGIGIRDANCRDMTGILGSVVRELYPFLKQLFL